MCWSTAASRWRGRAPSCWPTARCAPRISRAGSPIEDAMTEIFGTSLAVFIGLTVILFGGAAFMTGQALAGTWRPFWHAVPYALLLAAFDRFLIFGLFEG